MRYQRIDVSSEEGPEAYTISVRDNGIGIDPDTRSRSLRLSNGCTEGKYPGRDLGSLYAGRSSRDMAAGFG